MRADPLSLASSAVFGTGTRRNRCSQAATRLGHLSRWGYPELRRALSMIKVAPIPVVASITSSCTCYRGHLIAAGNYGSSPAAAQSQYGNPNVVSLSIGCKFIFVCVRGIIAFFHMDLFRSCYEATRPTRALTVSPHIACLPTRATPCCVSNSSIFCQSGAVPRDLPL
jgi:hypothetical protein